MGEGTKQKDANSKPKGTTVVPAVTSTEESNTQLLIIMLSVISGISAVLFIILIVVCVRCRLLRASSSEHVYSEPSPALQAHYEYIASLEAEKPRPQLADGYFEVADALPISQRGEQPASPAYAEVEQFAPLRKGPWSSQRDAGNAGKASMPEDNSSLAGRIEVIDVRTPRKGRASDKSKRHYANVTIINNGKPLPEYSNEIETKRPRRGVLDRLKGDRHSRLSDKDRKTGGASPQGSPKSKFRNSSDRKGPRLKENAPPQTPGPGAGDLDSVIYETYEGSAYEQVKPRNLDGSQTKEFPTNSPMASPQSLPETAATTTNAKGALNSDPRACAAGWKGTDPDQLNAKAGDIVAGRFSAETSNNQSAKVNTSLQRDIPKTKGIVKNGIKKFEANDAQS